MNDPHGLVMLFQLVGLAVISGTIGALAGLAVVAVTRRLGGR